MHRYEDFDDIRPYYDEEISEAVNRITSEPYFSQAIKFLIPNKNTDSVIEQIKKIATIFDFQEQVMHPVLLSIIQKSTHGLTFSGFDQLDPQTPYTFIANHRDIFLDSAFLQLALYEHQLPNSQITFGNNLMTSQLLIDAGKINRMFTVYRDGTRKEKYLNSIRLSKYIRETITQRKESIWIAQRDGRTKDGNDKTHPGLLKMLYGSERTSLGESLKALNIVPVAISYEFEPCDNLKVQEKYLSKDGKYEKKPGEDLNSILKGTIEQKGRVHLTAGTLLNNKLDELGELQESSDPFIHAAQLIDRQLHTNFKLYPNNYIAHDKLTQESSFSTSYTEVETQTFMTHIENRLKSMKGESKVLQQMLLEMYAAPVSNAIQARQSS